MIDDLKIDAIAFLNTAFDREARRLFQGFSELEREAWPFEYQEYLRWLQNSFATTEYMDMIAKSRGISSGEYLELTRKRVNAFKSISALMIGKLQAAREEIKRACTSEEIDKAKARGLLELETVFV